MDGNIPHLDATTPLDGVILVNGAPSFPTNGHSTNGAAAEMIAPSQQVISAGRSPKDSNREASILINDR